VPKEIKIVSRYDKSKVLYVAKGAADVRAAVEAAVASGANLGGADLRGANLGDADLGGANLGDADLGGADLRGADLGDADLRDANLGDADLGDADLRDANLRGAEGLNPYLTNDLLMMKDQVGKIRAYKLVNEDGEGPFVGTIKYEVKGDYEVTDANCSDDAQCGSGINLATLSWCISEWHPGRRILLAEFKASDIAALPNGNGKFRVHRCRIVKEVDLTEIGLVEKEEVPS
jgi:uncharacterized protein YjbI with pentapeptide repeats